MNNFDKIFANVLEKIKPTEYELALIAKIVDKLRKLLKKKAQELNIVYTSIEPQGSTGIKQTQLRNDFDIDLFIGFDYRIFKSKYKKLEKRDRKRKIKEDFLWYCNNWIKKSLSPPEFQNPRLTYAEHPYIQTDYVTEKETIKIDIVLYFDIDLKYIQTHGPITAVDRTPWHGKFVRETLTSSQKNDVRLLKQFFKACHSYGDVSSVGRIGFIGYSAELLIYHFKDLLTVFRSFKEISEKPLDYHGRSKQRLQSIHHFQNDYLIITDPIDENRNVASAISEKAYKYCNHQINQFLENPEKKFFEIKQIPEFNPEKSPKMAPHFFVIELKKTNKAIHYTEIRDKLYSFGDFIVTHGEKEFDHAPRFGEIIFEIHFIPQQNLYYLAFYCENPEINEEYKRRGPPLTQKKHVIKFKQAHNDFFSKNGFLWVKTKREYTSFLEFLKNMINQRISENLKVLSIRNASDVQTPSAKKAIYVLNNMILPFV
jgi:tRNA CCA-adding enzyme